MNVSARALHIFNAVTKVQTVSGIIFAVVDGLNHILIFSITLIIFCKCRALDYSRTALHAHFCTMGVMFLLSESLMWRNKYNFFLMDFRTKTKHCFHFGLALAGCSLTISGAIRKFAQRDRHFVTQHGRLGVIACTLYTINLVMGMCSISTNTHRFIMNLSHTVIGVTTYFIGFLATSTGFNTGFFHRNFYYIKVFKIVTAIIFVVTIKDSLILFLLHIGEIWENPTLEMHFIFD